ncbi:MAG: imidazole glycerol phosphate synthase subunit HisH [Clostridiales bacterium]|jgi:glutamine amidotransferase|nr:imidazole glycerol phosphate synthase subunit HisH [Clostridiales bacterium]
MVTIIDYNAGNLTSVRRALDFLDIKCKITSDPDSIAKAERIIFPGVGNAKSAMQNLKGGVADALYEAVKRGTPFFGICLGMQIMMTHSDEGDTECLSLFDGGVRLMTPEDKKLKIPHMGWDSLTYQKKHKLFLGVDPRSEFYFVHSYYVDPKNPDDSVALSEHGIVFTAVIGKENMFATQFHPEKSGEAGLTLLKNFAKWEGEAHAE